MKKILMTSEKKILVLIFKKLLMENLILILMKITKILKTINKGFKINKDLEILEIKTTKI